MGDRIVVRNGFVMTMDPDLGDLPRADVLIEDGTIAAVGPDLGAEDADVIEAAGSIVMPGFIDSHRHTWETAIRGCAPNATLDDYFVEVLDTFAPIYSPEDVYASNYAGALECINAGITTLVDWSHINNTPDHPDAGVSGLRDAGIRAQYAYGSANLSLNDYWNQSTIAIPGDDVRRIRDAHFSSDDGLLTMGLATRGPGFTVDDVVKAEWELARELDIPVTCHVGMGRLAGRFGMVKQLADLELLYEGTTYIHSCYLSDEEWTLVTDSGGTISIAAQVEMQMGHGWPPTGTCYAHGLRPSLSIDVVTTVPGDMFTQMRAAFGCERVQVNAVAWKDDVPIPESTVTARHMVEMATVNGAHVAQVEDRTGSLTVGKQADVIVIDGTAINTAPLFDPYATVALCADVSNVRDVIIGGTVHKRDGAMLANVAAARTGVRDARDRLAGQVTAQQAWSAVDAR
jgi:cytosine/adenosine deaminase-related metal-dependent hydrolase